MFMGVQSAALSMLIVQSRETGTTSRFAGREDLSLRPAGWLPDPGPAGRNFGCSDQVLHNPVELELLCGKL